MISLEMMTILKQVFSSEKNGCIINQEMFTLAIDDTMEELWSGAKK